MARRVQVSQGRAKPDAVRVIQRHWAYAAGLRGIMVGTVGESGLATGFVERGLVWQHFVGFEPPDDNRAFRTMEVVIGKIRVRFDFSKGLNQFRE